MLERWRVSYRKGNYLPAFWGTVTRARLSEQAKYEIFGMVHMSMHKTADEHAHNRQRLIFLENRLAAQDEKIKALGASRRQLQKDFNEFARRAASLQSALDAERKKKDQITVEPASPAQQQVLTAEDNRRLRDKLEEKNRRIGELQQTVAELGKKVAQQKAALSEQKESQANLRQDSRETLGRLLENTLCSEDCPSFNLCRKRILIVGGIARMEAQYRRIIEEGGGVFEYYERHMKGGPRQLENSLKRADIVLCPVNRNSHAACSPVKNLGKKHRKPVHMLPNFSLSAVTQAMTLPMPLAIPAKSVIPRAMITSLILVPFFHFKPELSIKQKRSRGLPYGSSGCRETATLSL